MTRSDTWERFEQLLREAERLGIRVMRRDGREIGRREADEEHGDDPAREGFAGAPGRA